MRVNKIDLENGHVVHVIQEIGGLRYSMDRWVLGVILGFDPIAETDLEIVECELVLPGSDLFEVTVGERREIGMSGKTFDRLVAVVAAYRAGELE